jgi:voltage-gated potassium channel
MYTAFEAPVSFVMEYDVAEHNMWWDGLFSIIFFTDIILRLTGKLKLPNHTENVEISESVTSTYLCSGWLPVDILTSMPFDIIAAVLGLSIPLRVLSLLRLARLVRIIKLRSLIKIFDVLPKWAKASLIVGTVMTIIHWIACGWIIVNPQTQLDPITFYNHALYWTITTLTTVGYGDITPTTNIGRVYTMAIMLVGAATYGIIIANFSRLIMLADKYKEEKKSKMNGMMEFMKYYNIPMSLQKQVYSFYNHLLTKNISDEDSTIIKDLPQALQNELNIYQKIKFIRSVHIFKDASTPCLKMIAEKLEQTFHSPNEYIIRKGDMGGEMFIIGHGELEVTSGEKVLNELKAGQFFGEIALLQDTVRGADVKTNSYCDLYTFKKEDFLEVIIKYPTLKNKFEQRYQKREADKKAMDNNSKAA